MSEPFDPDAFLANAYARPSAPAFDPDAFLAARAPKVGPGETYLSKTLGMLPLAKPVTNLLATAIADSPGGQAIADGQSNVALTDSAKEQLRAMGQEPVDPDAPRSSLLPTYRAIRERGKNRDAAGEQQNKLAAALGKGTGFALNMLAPLPKVGVGSQAFQATRAGRMANGAANGAAYGAGIQATEGNADLTKGELAQWAGETGGGAITGMLAGGALQGAVEGVRPLAGALQRGATNAARRVLLKGADSMSKNAKVSDEAIMEALRSGAIKIGSTAESAEAKLSQLKAIQGAEYGDILAKLEAAGVKGPDAQEIYKALTNAGVAAGRQSLNPAIKAEYMTQADRVLEATEDALGNPLNGADRIIPLTQGENLKRSLQKLAKYSKVEDTPLNDVRKEIAGVLRRANETAIDDAARAAPAGSEVANLGAQFVGTKQRFGRLAEATAAARRGAARESQKQGGGLTGDAAAMLAAATAGGPGAVAGGLGLQKLKSLGPSAEAVVALYLADALRAGAPGIAQKGGGMLSGPALKAAENAVRQWLPESSTDKTEALIEALRRKP